MTEFISEALWPPNGQGRHYYVEPRLQLARVNVCQFSSDLNNNKDLAPGESINGWYKNATGEDYYFHPAARLTSRRKPDTFALDEAWLLSY